MYFTLHWYILRELLKVFVITAVSLTVILALGGLLQPLRHQGVSAVQLFELIIFSFPVMLTFSLPVAALLATTLVYGRLSADNELIACRASGVSLWALIVPAIAIGVFVLLTNLLLSNWFIPGCSRKTKSVVEQDIQDIVLTKLKNDKQLNFEKLVIAAERAEKTRDNPPCILLSAPSFAEFQNNRPQRVVWCRQALLQFDAVTNTVTIWPDSAVGMSWSDAHEPARIFRLPISRVVPPLTRDDTSFKSYGELKTLRAHPEPYYRVKRELDKCRDVAEKRLLLEEIYDAVKPRPGQPGLRSIVLRYEDTNESPIALRDVLVQANDVELTQDGMLLGRANETGQAVLTLLGKPAGDGRPGPKQKVYTARLAKLLAVTRNDDAGPRIDVTFPDPYEMDPQRGPASVVKNPKGKMAERLLPTSNIVDRVAGMSLQQLTAVKDPQIDALTQVVAAQVDGLRRNIVAELHGRGAFSVAGLVLVLLGSALGIHFRSGHVLVAFGVAAVPAMFAIAMVVMGKQTATHSGSLQQFGVLLIWSGNLLILLLDGWVYGRLLKH